MAATMTTKNNTSAPTTPEQQPYREDEWVDAAPSEAAFRAGPTSFVFVPKDGVDGKRRSQPVPESAGEIQPSLPPAAPAPGTNYLAAVAKASKSPGTGPSAPPAEAAAPASPLDERGRLESSTISREEQQARLVTAADADRERARIEDDARRMSAAERAAAMEALRVADEASARRLAEADKAQTVRLAAERKEAEKKLVHRKCDCLGASSGMHRKGCPQA